MRCRFGSLFLLIYFQSFSQTQTCPVNINFASGDLTHWFAYTGNNMQSQVPLIQNYDSNVSAPAGTRGARSIEEYNLSSVQGIQVITSSFNDIFGGFQTIPTINGYNYNYSIKLGSTAITRGNANGAGGGGYKRGVSYSITVPPGPATEPYTMTYAYAMVLENGTHATKYQAFISATLRTSAGVIVCASPSYTLPTFNNTNDNGLGASLDSAAAKRNGFTVSRIPSPNPSQNRNTQVISYLQDVWTKNWTEVTFDLSAYRGQQVSLTFEADNCVPGGHFAYGYIAIRNSCAGLEISGDSIVCNNSLITYSVPSLAGATYSWNIPGSWTLLTSDTGNIIQVRASSLNGILSVREKNSCADLTDTIQIKTQPSPEAGKMEGSTTVCEGQNISTLQLVNYSGKINSWQYSTDSINWTYIPVTTMQYSPQNLNTTTAFRVVVSKGTVCPSDTSDIAVVVVDKKSVGGELSPPDAALCAGQTTGEILHLSGNYGSVLGWQYSTDGVNWLTVADSDTNSVYTVKGITEATQFRSITKNGVCPADSSAVASIAFVPVNFPQANIFPQDTTICYGTKATLNARINIGTSYTWIPVSSGNGNIPGIPYDIVNEVQPENTTDYVLSVLNSGCPNALTDTFHVSVLPPVIVDAGDDTSVVVGQPVQFHATTIDKALNTYSWFPETELNNPNIADPIGIYNLSDNIIKYTVTATTPGGCTGVGNITVKIFKTKPDIFVPNAFTPGGGINSVFRPIPVGVASLEYFRIYNRYGQLVFSTSTIGNGWDGNINGSPQSIGAYVWMVKGTDYLGDVIIKKGTMVLIR